MTLRDAIAALKLRGINATRPKVWNAILSEAVPQPRKTSGNYDYSEEDIDNLAEYLSQDRRPGPKACPFRKYTSPRTKTPLSELPAGPEMNGWLHQLWVGHVDWQDFKAWSCPPYSESWESFGGLLEKVKIKGAVFSVSTTESLEDICRRLIAFRYTWRK